MKTPFNLVANAEKLLQASDIEARLAAANTLQELISVPGVLKNLSLLDQLMLGSVFLCASNYPPTNPGKEEPEGLGAALTTLWSTWLDAVVPWSQPAQELPIKEGYSWALAFAPGVEDSWEEPLLPSMGWQLAKGCIHLGLAPELKALLSQHTSPPAEELSSQVAGLLSLKFDVFDTQPREGRVVPKIPLETTLLGLCLDRQVVARHGRDKQAIEENTLDLLDVLQEFGVDFKRPTGPCGLYPLAFAQDSQVLGVLMDHGAVTQLETGPSSALSAGVWDIPFLFRDRWASLLHVMMYWEGNAQTKKWKGADEWLWGFADSLSSMPTANISSAMTPVEALLRPVMNVAKSAGSPAQQVARGQETWVGAVSKGLVLFLNPTNNRKLSVYTSEQLKKANMVNGWSPAPGEAVWWLLANVMSQPMDVGVVGKSSQKELFAGSSFSGLVDRDDVHLAMKELGKTPGGWLRGLIACVRLSSLAGNDSPLPFNGWVNTLLESTLMHAPLRFKHVDYDLKEFTGVAAQLKIGLDSAVAAWEKAPSNSDLAFATIGLAHALDKLGNLKPYGPLSSPLPCREVLLDQMDSSPLLTPAWAAWLRSQHLEEGLPLSPPRSAPKPRF